MNKLMKLIARGIIERLPERKRLLHLIIALAIFCLFLWRAFHVFTPHFYNSDAAIPVMMSNEERPVTVFSLYYYGADRWGGWPFLVAKLIRYLTGYRWSYESLFIVQATWVFSGALVLASLSRRDRLPVMVVYLLSLCLQQEARFMLFELSQVYAWQLTALLLSWYSLRRFFESYAGAARTVAPTWKIATWAFLLHWFSYLAIWSSVASIPSLIFLFCVEAWRLYLRTEDARRGQRLRRAYLYGAALIVWASVSEFLQKSNYHRYSQKRFGNSYLTDFALDTGYLAQNLKIHLDRFHHYSWLPQC